MIFAESRLVYDTASPALGALLRTAAFTKVQTIAGTAAARVIKAHIAGLPPNKNGWPSQRFWEGCVRGTDWERTPDGVKVSVQNEEHPGAFAHAYFGGTVVPKKRKWLTIPARAEFYGHRAPEFTNLKFVKYSETTAAFLIGTGGAGKVDFGTGREKNVTGAGKRSAGMVAYWLKKSVRHEPRPEVMPQERDIVAAVIADIRTALAAKRPEGGAL